MITYLENFISKEEIILKIQDHFRNVENKH